MAISRALPADAVVITENTSGELFQFSRASQILQNAGADSEVVYSLSGADADLFTIDANGIVSLADGLDYENPADSDADGSYDVIITASFENKRGVEVTVTQDVTIAVEDDPDEEGITVDEDTNTYIGTESDDEIRTTDSADTVEALGGDDFVYTDSGDDWISGGSGNDELRGGGGQDTIYGDEGDDLVIGNGSDDLLYGGLGNDDLRGGGGIDLVDGGAGDDTLAGGRNDDTFVLSTGNDIITDFDPAAETIVLNDATFTYVDENGDTTTASGVDAALAALTDTEDGASFTYMMDGEEGTLTISGVTASDLSTSSFLTSEDDIA
ncbi:calcium-binding protein [Roseibium sp. RKSG952]|uniref:calcium-binding protein n=1 Tax=Roseibium sp. RKSG952 TaxID=2529384 RepID=UPI0012BD402E|nr:calcium-binding protein [Roseibium sp. RKSG952]MTH96483.1 hypothetical protein [Roseibium sp. RKSG952]